MRTPAQTRARAHALRTTSGSRNACVGFGESASMSLASLEIVTTKLGFLGAVETVTGSRYLLQSPRARVLVDCGLFQGPKKLRERNWAPVQFDVKALDAVLLTHAHIDHSGYLPRLCTQGYGGPIYCTRGTRDLLTLLLPDAGRLQEEEARHANKWGYARHRPALPLFTEDDARRCLDQLEVVGFHQRLDVADGVTATFTRAGHIIGSACIAIACGDTRITFSGDVGRAHDPLMRPPEPLAETDYLIVESTYGDRRHPTEDVSNAIARTITETIEKRGVLIVPAFAVGRAQHLLDQIARLREERRIPECPVYLDSPMAIDATRIFTQHLDDHVLSASECASRLGSARFVRTPDDSKAIDASSGPMIVVAASGMCTGGRVLHHLQRFLPDERTTVMIVGYQAAGTRGRSLLDGADELKIFGQYVPVRARIVGLDGLSAHADYAELVDWLRASKLSPREVFVTHGEPAAADAFRRRLREAFGWRARVPELGETVTLGAP
jgi:metallo-beta-lactamase family protein